MHRWIARYLLLVALVGTFGPLARAATTAPPHACCVRKALHHCHDSVGLKTEQLVIRDSGGCCNNSCRRAVVTIRWAHAPTAGISWARRSEPYRNQSSTASQSTIRSHFHSSRAPPYSSIS